MKIRYFSDIHLDFYSGSLWTPKPLEEDSDTVLVLAGDLHNGGWLHSSEGVAWLTKLSIQFREVLIVLGNHDYYGGWNNELEGMPDDIHKELENSGLDNVHLLQRNCIKIEDVIFIGATLWTNLDGVEHLYERGMSDCRFIRNEYGFLINAGDIKQQHNRDIQFIKDSLDVYKGCKTVVITHHAPSEKSVGERFRGDAFNPCFHSHLDGVIETYKPNAWIHGHMHNPSNYFIGGCNVVCNPRGYDGEGVYMDEESYLTIEV